ncbi:squalene synthase HpnC [Alcaligenaceae bacterium]|nr:squalene synthase HpnC [Alcaligenaceae bacterium]
MAVDHYENFPVASLLLPRRLRLPVKNIYRYARTADDIADEGTASPDQRLAQLAAYKVALEQIAGAGLELPPQDHRIQIFLPLQDSIREHALPLQPFFDLLSAFEQDVGVSRYPSNSELMDYCRRSANPVGQLMLHLYQAASPENLVYSDAICTGLQLTNFWQDVAIDRAKDRIYIPLDRLQHHGITQQDIDDKVHAAERSRSHAMPGYTAPDPAWQALMQEQVAQARTLLLNGLPLTQRLPGRIGLELKLVVHGGLRILERLDQLHYDIFLHRPSLQKRDWAVIIWRALRG